MTPTPADQLVSIKFKHFGAPREYSVDLSLTELAAALTTGKLDDKILSYIQIYEVSEDDLGTCKLQYSFDTQRAGGTPWQLV